MQTVADWEVEPLSPAIADQSAKSKLIFSFPKFSGKIFSTDRRIIKGTQFIRTMGYQDLGITGLDRKVRLGTHGQVEKIVIDLKLDSPDNH